MLLFYLFTRNIGALPRQKCIRVIFICMLILSLVAFVGIGLASSFSLQAYANRMITPGFKSTIDPITVIWLISPIIVALWIMLTTYRSHAGEQWGALAEALQNPQGLLTIDQKTDYLKYRFDSNFRISKLQFQAGERVELLFGGIVMILSGALFFLSEFWPPLLTFPSYFVWYIFIYGGIYLLNIYFNKKVYIDPQGIIIKWGSFLWKPKKDMLIPWGDIRAIAVYFKEFIPSLQTLNCGIILTDEYLMMFRPRLVGFKHEQTLNLLDYLAVATQLPIYDVSEIERRLNGNAKPSIALRFTRSLVETKEVISDIGRLLWAFLTPPAFVVRLQRYILLCLIIVVLAASGLISLQQRYIADLPQYIMSQQPIITYQLGEAMPDWIFKDSSVASDSTKNAMQTLHDGSGYKFYQHNGDFYTGQAVIPHTIPGDCAIELGFSFPTITTANIWQISVLIHIGPTSSNLVLSSSIRLSPIINGSFRLFAAIDYGRIGGNLDADSYPYSWNGIDKQVVPWSVIPQHIYHLWVIEHHQTIALYFDGQLFKIVTIPDYLPLAGGEPGVYFSGLVPITFRDYAVYPLNGNPIFDTI
jgi:hypothetical protein